MVRTSVGERPFVLNWLAVGRQSFLNPVSINLMKLSQMPTSRFLKIVQETGQIPVCSFYLAVSTSRNHPVQSTATRCNVSGGRYDCRRHMRSTVVSREIETAVFDPASVFLNTLMKSETQPASVVSINREETDTPASEFLPTPRNCDRDCHTPLYTKNTLCDYSVWKTASSVWRLARAAAASGTVSSPVPAAGSPSGRVNVTMSEAERGWADMLHESALEASSSQASAKPASGSRQGCMGATATRVILRVLPQPIFLCDTASC